MPKKKQTPKSDPSLELGLDLNEDTTSNPTDRETASNEASAALSDDELFSLQTDAGHVDSMFSSWFLEYASYVILERA
ncbi:MAG: hypothetical protein CNE95_05240, partial [Puniceicoccaceae bacterium MED-G30]